MKQLNTPGDEATMRAIHVSGVNYHNGFSSITIEARGDNGSLIDVYSYESTCHSYEELYAKYARKAIKFLRSTYGIKELHQAPLRKAVQASMEQR